MSIDTPFLSFRLKKGITIKDIYIFVRVYATEK